MLRSFASIVVAANLLAGCAKPPPPPVWMRTDGRIISGDPALTQQFQIDRTICLGDREKADLSGVTISQGGWAGVAASINRSNAANAVFSGCMAQKGYVQLAADQAAAVHDQLASTIAQRQAIAAQQPPQR
jgi:hypothetical protein